METWQNYRKEMRLRITFPQQKEAARKRVASGHTSRLGRMGRDGFVATFTKDYVRPPTMQEIEYAMYYGYPALCAMLSDRPDPLEQHGEADPAEVAQQEAEGRHREAERSGDPVSDDRPRDVVGDIHSRSATSDADGDDTAGHHTDASDCSGSEHGSYSDID
ncbi:hypothetical protein GOP47_0000170 [Adiantum capillus-veneris]|uniref:Uncharacterized protein n=1 Tax=Adiantum capillus-veneris TaxID=13818 RepID=A0A9D4VCJ2_ADICA|nr:hypothetical protein GOP47_0000170 [Adiantum capillus-veneris]